MKRRRFSRRRTIRRKRPRTSRRSFKRRTRRTRVRTDFRRGLNYIGDKAVCRFEYVNEFQMQAASGGDGVIGSFPGNYLPGSDIPSLGPMLNQYTEMRIPSSSISVTYTNLEPNTSRTVGVAPLAQGIAAFPTPTSTIYLSEQPRCKSKYLTPLSGSFSRCTIKHRATTAQSFGDRTPSTSAQDLIVTSSPTAMPTQFWNWGVFTQQNFETGTDVGVQALVRIRYTIEFYGRKTLTV